MGATIIRTRIRAKGGVCVYIYIFITVDVLTSLGTIRLIPWGPRVNSWVNNLVPTKGLEPVYIYNCGCSDQFRHNSTNSMGP